MTKAMRYVSMRPQLSTRAVNSNRLVGRPKESQGPRLNRLFEKSQPLSKQNKKQKFLEYIIPKVNFNAKPKPLVPLVSLMDVGSAFMSLHCGMTASLTVLIVLLATVIARRPKIEDRLALLELVGMSRQGISEDEYNEYLSEIGPLVLKLSPHHLLLRNPNGFLPL
ncbi:hypothetical protein KIN20_004511 [Parelaphostrongylus tenuis]|uniref:Uncharacterized protein n=1 Tax=Parelaphostrongylus tenuis TaxID=148309 RepID=A0AAD5LYK3_PARTN|nr:hypothetical protein KIN20_004511 [Parelaphostrongylus tenuis]